jgi:DNA-binding IclR family transcriptional regulator
MQEQETSYEDQLMAWLRSKSGDVVVISAIAKKFKVGHSSMMALLNELVACGKVRRSNSKKSAGFYVPSVGQINAERRMAELEQVRPPLKVSKERAELYAQLAAVRDSIKSIG